jgi:lipoprotein-anchoring transpeptidase ErfK/SrfK
MKFKYLPILAFAAMTVAASSSPADVWGGIGKFFRKLGRDCTWNNNDPFERAQTDYDRLTTTPPPNAHFPVVPFQESDFSTKPWLREFEYVIVVNNSNSIVQNEVLPPGLPINLPSPMELGIADKDTALPGIQAFKAQFGYIADQVYRFGAVKYGPDRKTPVPSNIIGAQTIRVYRRGQLIRVTKVSTGRNQFEIRGQDPVCRTRPAKSYYYITEPGYFTFQELVKSGYQSASYDDADMPNAMFYMRERGIALHEEPVDRLISILGRRASGGCTRLDPDTANNLFDSVYATRGAQIPIINRDGTPLLNASGQWLRKSQEIVTYYEGTKRERSTSGPAYSALLIVQPHSVLPTNPYAEQSVNFRFNRETFNSNGPARF